MSPLLAVPLFYLELMSGYWVSGMRMVVLPRRPFSQYQRQDAGCILMHLGCILMHLGDWGQFIFVPSHILRALVVKPVDRETSLSLPLLKILQELKK